MTEERNQQVTFVRATAKELTYAEAQHAFTRSVEKDGCIFVVWHVVGFAGTSDEQYVVVNAFAALDRLGIEA